MTDRTRIVVVRKRDLIAGSAPEDWDDPHGLSILPKEKRAALIENPLSTSDDDPVQILGLKGRKIIGKLDVFAGFMHVGGVKTPCLWTSAYGVPDAYRNTLIGLSLIVTMHKLAPVSAACGVSKMALPVLLKMNWRDFVLPRYILPIRSRPIVVRYIGDSLASAAISSVVDIGLTILRNARRVLHASESVRLSCQPQVRMSEELEPLLSANPQLISAHRSVRWMNWVLSHSLGADNTLRQLFYIYADEQRLVGYFILKIKFYPIASHRGFKNLHLGTIADWRIFDSDLVSVQDLLTMAQDVLLRSSVDAIEVCTKEECAASFLKQFGYRRVGELHVLSRSDPPALISSSRTKKTIDWQFSSIEGDNLLD